MSTELHDIQALVKLFDPRRDEDNNSDDDYTDNPSSSKTQQQKCTKEKKINPYAKLEEPERKEREVTEFSEDNYFDLVPEASSDWRKVPQWTLNYKQKVSAEDVFLQMGPKSPATASCEDMVIVVRLPGEQMQNMNINVLPQKLEVTSPNFALKIPLPHPVDPQKGNARWDKDKEELLITLRMDREFDFINL